MSKFITAKLTYKPTHCECCGTINTDYTVYKNGTKTSRITLPTSGVYPTYLRLKKQRFYCKSCRKSFSAKTSIVRDHCFISDHTKAKILVESRSEEHTSVLQSRGHLVCRLLLEKKNKMRRQL